MKKIKKMKKKILKWNRICLPFQRLGTERGMIIFSNAGFMVPIYSLLKDSLKVHGLENYWYVLTNDVVLRNNQHE